MLQAESTSKTRPIRLDSLGNPDLGYSTFTTFDGTEHLQEEWDAFMESIGAEVFLSYDWCRIWWKYYGQGRELRVFIFRTSGAVAGILPIFIEEIRCLTVKVKVARIVASHAMPTTVRVPILRSVFGAAVKAFATDLFSHCGVDLVHLGPLSGGYPDFENLLETCRVYAAETPCQVDTFTGDVQTYYYLEPAWEKQLSRLSKQERKRIRRSYKEIESARLPFTVSYADGRSLASVLDAFVKLHQARWQKVGKAGHFADWPYAREFHEENAAVQLQRGRLRLLELRINDKPIGYKFAFRFGQGMCAFLDARSESDMPGGVQFSHLAFSEQMQRAIREGVKWVDCMRGYYEHKHALGGTTEPIGNILLHRGGPSVSFKVFVLRKAAFIYDGFYYKLFHNRIAPLLLKSPRPLRSWWLCTHTLLAARQKSCVSRTH
jgi:CelD/BcsL family acetyltransferase involved in cellulose biosynthesis